MQGSLNHGGADDYRPNARDAVGRNLGCTFSRPTREFQWLRRIFLQLCEGVTNICYMLYISTFSGQTVGDVRVWYPAKKSGVVLVQSQTSDLVGSLMTP